MLLSTILMELKIDDIEFINEQSFETLGLSVSKLNSSICTFIDNEKFLNTLGNNVSMVITNRELASKVKNCGVCITTNPRVLFFKVHNYLENNDLYRRSYFKTIIGCGCNINEKSIISENNVIIGNNVIIEEFAIIRENTVIGDNSIIRAGSIIGGEGFEFKRINDTIMGVKHLGGVKIGHNVEIQYNVCVDKAVYPWDDTEINENTKIDNFVHIAHAVKLEKNIMIAANTSIAGRVTVGKNTWIGLNSIISNGLTIGEYSHIGIGSVVVSDIPSNTRVFGNPARAYENKGKVNEIDNKLEYKFLEIVSNILKIDKGNINLELKRQELSSWDSIAHIILVAELEEEFNIKIPINDVPNLNCLNDFLKYIK